MKMKKSPLFYASPWWIFIHNLILFVLLQISLREENQYMSVKSPQLVLKRVLHLPAAVAGFYVKEAVLNAVNQLPESSMKIRLEEDIQDLTYAFNKYSEKLAGALFDYIALACFGEARHAPYQANRHIPQICFKFDQNNEQQCIKVREQSYHHALKFDPYIFLPTLKILFYDSNWREAYGGNKWGNIADAGTMYNKVSPQVFIDHAVDLSHNGGSMFTKNVLFRIYESGAYRYMLNQKKEKVSILVKEFLRYHPIAFSVKPFLKLAAKLNIMDPELIFDNLYYTIEFPETIKWGLLPIKPSDIIDNDSFEIDEHDEDYEEDSHEIFHMNKIRAMHMKPNLDKIKYGFKTMEQASMF